MNGCLFRGATIHSGRYTINWITAAKSKSSSDSTEPSGPIASVHRAALLFSSWWIRTALTEQIMWDLDDWCHVLQPKLTTHHINSHPAHTAIQSRFLKTKHPSGNSVITCIIWLALQLVLFSMQSQMNGLPWNIHTGIWRNRRRLMTPQSVGNDQCFEAVGVKDRPK